MEEARITARAGAGVKLECVPMPSPRCFGFGASLALAAAFAAPVSALDPKLAVTQLRATRWTQREGLPQSSVLSIEQDLSGDLWLGTQEGVARFDGVDFESFTVETTPELGHNYAQALHLDPAGRLWVGNEVGTLATHHAGRFTAFAPSTEFRGSVAGIASAGGGETFVAFRQSGLFRVRGERLERVALDPARPAVPIGILTRGRGAALWVGAAGGVYRYQDAAWTYFEVPWARGRLITALAQDRQGELWLATDSALSAHVRIEGERLLARRPAVQLSAAIRSLYADAAGSLWLGTEDGLYRLLEEAGAHPERVPAVPEGAVDTVREDGAGNLWIGTRVHGLLRLRADEVVPFGRAEGLPLDTCWNVLETRDGTLYASTDGGLARLPAGGAVRFEGVRSRLFPTSDIVALTEMRDGSLFAGTFRHGAFRLPPGGREWRAVGAGGGIPPGPITVVFEDREGRIWIGSREGLARGDLHRLEPVALGTGVAQPYVSSIVEDARGTVWVATTGAGLFGFAGDRAMHVGRAEGLPSEQLNALHLDAAGRLWIATNDRGLAVLHQGRIGQVGTRHGLPYAIILWLVEDHAGNLWMSTGHGLLRAALEDLARVAFAPASPTGEAQVTIKRLSESDGMRDAEFNNTGQPAGWCARDGRLWFPAGGGLAMVDPARLSDPVPPRAAVRRITADGRLWRIEEGSGALTIPPGRGELEIRFTAPSFDEPEGTRFRYRLLGFDEDWRDAGVARTARYTNLPPAGYRFEVAAQHQDGGSFGPSASLDLTLQPRLVQSWPFRALLTLVVATLAMSVVRWRSQRLRALVARRTAELSQANAELAAAVGREQAARALAEGAQHDAERAANAKSDFLAAVSHELRTPLHAILGANDLLLASPLDERQRGFGDLVRESGEDLLGLVDDLLDVSRIEHDQLALAREPFDLVHCLETAVAMSAAAAAAKGLALSFELAPRELRHAVGDERRVRQVANNLIANAVKFTERGSVSVLARIAEAGSDLVLELVVRDTGVGIPAEAQAAIFQPFVQAEAGLARRFGGVGLGLAIASRLAAAMAGRIEVESRAGVGSTFRAFLCLGRGAPRAADPPAQDASSRTRAPLAILTVEDDEVNRKVVRAMLLSLGYDCDFAVDGEEALAAAALRAYDLVFLDLHLPGIDGFEVARHLRQGGASGRPVLVALTANAMDRERERGRALGMEDFLVKPLRLAELSATLERVSAARRDPKAP